MAVVALLAAVVPTAAASPQPQRRPGEETTAPIKSSSVVRILTPVDESLVERGPLVVKIWLGKGARDLQVRADEGDVTRAFRRHGRIWQAKLTEPPVGIDTIYASAVVRGKRVGTQVRVTVQDRRQDLVQPAQLPRSWQATTGDGVQPVALRIDPDATVDARLNGREVRLGRPRSGNLRLASLSVADGLRAGSNSLVVKAWLRNGRWDMRTLRFRVAANTPMAEAGADLDVRAGQTVSLDGRRSLAGARGRTLRHSWKLLIGPVGADLTMPAEAAQAPTTEFTPSKPGRYLVSLTVSESGGNRPISTSTDLIEVNAMADVPPLGVQLATLFDPIGEQEGPGLRLGDTWTPWDQYFSGSRAGVYFIDPRSLQWATDIDNAEFKPVPLPNTGTDAALTAAVAKVPAGTLVVIVGQDGCCEGSSELPTKGAFSHIISYNAQTGRGEDLLTGGVWNRGLPVSDGYRAPDPAGSLSGFLRYQVGSSSGSTNGSFRFVQDDNVRFSTAGVSAATTSTNDGAVYRLLASDGSQAADISGAAGPVTMPDPSADSGQQWQMIRAYGDFYKLVNRRTGLCLDVTGFQTAVQQYACDPGSHNQLNQLWAPSSQDDGSYTLRSAVGIESGNLARLLTRGSDGSLSIATSPSGVPSGSQQWVFSIPPGLYTITTSAGLALAEPDYQRAWGNQLRASASTGELAQQWQLTDKPDGSFAIQNVGSGLCLDVSGGATTPGTHVNRYECVPETPDQPNQRWLPFPTSRGMLLRSALPTRAGSELYLGVDANGGLQIQTYDELDSATTYWVLDRLPDPVANGSYTLSAADGSGRTLQSKTTSNLVAAAATAPSSVQDWRLEPAADGTVTVQSRGTGFCLGADGSAAVRLTDCDPENATGWQLQSLPDGSIAVASASKQGQVLTVQADGNLVLGGDSSASSAHWLFTGRPVTFELGDRRYPTSLPTGGSGFAVLGVDSTLRPMTGFPRVFSTNGAGGSIDDQNALSTALQQIQQTPGALALVQTVGRPRPNSSAWNAIAASLAALGGSKSSVLAMDGTGDYALVGCAGCGSSRQPSYDERLRRSAAEPGDTPIVGARLEGDLSRNAGSGIQASLGGASRVDASFYALSSRPTSPWPYSDAQASPRHYAVLTAIANHLDLSSSGSCGQDGLDPVRRNYCLWQYDQTHPWTDDINLLEDWSYQENTSYGAQKFTDVKNQIIAELGQLDDVHQMVAGQRDLFRDAVDGTQSNAAAIASTITGTLPAPKGPTHSVIGGVLKVLGVTYSFGKLIAGVAEPPGGAPSLDSVTDNIDNFTGFISGMVQLAGDNRDDSTGVSLDLVRDATEYATDLGVQYEAVIANMSTVENVIVSDPVKLGVAAANTTQAWAFPANQRAAVQTNLTAGSTRDLWTKLFGEVYEMWQWPTIDTGNAVTDIACSNDPDYTFHGYHYIYTGQDRRGIFQPPLAVDSNGKVTSTGTLLLTRPESTKPWVFDNVDRVLHPPVADLFFKGNSNVAGTGYAPDELPDVYADTQLPGRHGGSRENCLRPLSAEESIDEDGEAVRADQLLTMHGRRMRHLAEIALPDIRVVEVRERSRRAPCAAHPPRPRPRPR